MQINFKHKISAVIAAAGKSSRMGLPNGISKQFIEVNGKTVIEKTIAAFDSCGYIDEIIVAARPEDIGKIWEIIKKSKIRKIKDIISGGATRRESVANAAALVSNHMEYIAIHDGARCFISHEDIKKTALKAFETGAAAAGAKITDTVKYAGNGGRIIRTLDRDNLWAVYTPQIFEKNLYMSAIKNFTGDVTDDCAVVEKAGHPVYIVECSRYNIKITETEDLEYAGRI